MFVLVLIVFAAGIGPVCVNVITLLFLAFPKESFTPILIVWVPAVKLTVMFHIELFCPCAAVIVPFVVWLVATSEPSK